MDFVTLWKASSIVLTGCFGILGLIKEFKDKNTGRITKWGRVSLVGILLSTSLGVVAQLKESSNQQQARDSAAQKTLELAKNTDQTVRDLQRILASLEEPQIEMGFWLNCQEPKFKATCLATRSVIADQKIWRQWPRDQIDNEPKFYVSLNFFRERSKADSFAVPLYARTEEADLAVDILVGPDSKNTSIQLNRFENSFSLAVTDDSPHIEANSRRITSMIDLSESVLIITDSGSLPLLRDLTPNYLRIHTKNGQSIELREFERIMVGDEVVFRAVLPNLATQE
jgi:hypothetical protein